MKVKRKKTRYDKLMGRQAYLTLRVEANQASPEELEEITKINRSLEFKEKGRFGGERPSKVQESLIQQTYHYHRQAQALIQAVGLAKEVLDGALDDEVGIVDGAALHGVHRALESPEKFVEWASKEAERRAREEIEDGVDGGTADSDVADGDGGGDAPGAAHAETG